MSKELWTNCFALLPAATLACASPLVSITGNPLLDMAVFPLAVYVTGFGIATREGWRRAHCQKNA